MPITDLTGTKWVLNRTIPIAQTYLRTNYYISFSSNNNTYGCFGLGDEGGGDPSSRLLFGANPSSFIFVYTYIDDDEIIDTWQNEAYRTIQITGGTDATNSELIAWLEANATQQQQQSIPERAISLQNLAVFKEEIEAEIPTKVSDLTNDSGFTSNTGTVIGSSLTADTIVLGNGTVNVKTSTYKPASSSTTWIDSSDVYLPTMKSVKNYVTGKGYTTNTGTVTSVTIGVGTGLSVSSSSAITTSGTRTISISSGYKLPTTSEWNAKLATYPNGYSPLITSSNKINEVYLPDSMLGQLLYAGSLNIVSGTLKSSYSTSECYVELTGNAKSLLGASTSTSLTINDITVSGTNLILLSDLITKMKLNTVKSVGMYLILNNRILSLFGMLEYSTVSNATITDVSSNVSTGDWLVVGSASSSSVTFQKIDNTDAVTSVNNKLGAVTLRGSDIAVSSSDSTKLDVALGNCLPKTGGTISGSVLVSDYTSDSIPYGETRIYPNYTSVSEIDGGVGTTTEYHAGYIRNGDVNLTLPTSAGTLARTSEIVDSELKSRYHLGAFDTVDTSNADYDTITRQTGYLTISALPTVKWSPDTNVYGGLVTLSGYLEGATNITTSGIKVYSTAWKQNETCIVYAHNSNDPAGQYRLFWNTTIVNGDLPIKIQYKLATSYTEKVIKNQPLSTLDQQGSQWVRNEWEKTLNLCSSLSCDAWNYYFGCWLKPNTTYFFKTAYDSGQNYKVSLLNSSGTTVQTLYSNYDTYNVNGFVFTTGDISEGRYILRSQFATSQSASQTYESVKPMLNEGNHSYPYQPYRGEIVRRGDIKTAEITMVNGGAIIDNDVPFIMSVMYVDGNGNYVYGVPNNSSVYITTTNHLYYYAQTDAVGKKIKVVYMCN